MDKEALRTILQSLSAGDMDVHEALSKLQSYPYEELGEGVCMDTHRSIRTGQGEVIFGQNKSMSQLAAILASHEKKNMPVLITRIQEDTGQKLADSFSHGEFYPSASVFTLNKKLKLTQPWKSTGEVLVVTAGSSDLPVGLEAFASLQFFNVEPGLIPDVGVAGLHRILPHQQTLKNAKILIVIAGMEGALPGVLAGMTGKPILAVPTSVGYGASFQGIAPLLTMLNTCAPGIAVVNIDNGYGAAAMAIKLLMQS